MVSEMLDSVNMENWETWKKDIHQNFTENLVVQWKNRGFDCEQTREWVNIGFLKPKHFEIVSYLKQNYCSVENFKKSLSRSIGKNERIEKIFWAHPSFGPCALVISSSIDEINKKSGKFKINLLVYDPKENDPWCVKIFSNSSNLEEARARVRSIKDELEGEVPVLALLRSRGEKILLSEVVKDVRLEIRKNVINKPDSCIKKHDIISIEMDSKHSLGLKHAAVYLTNKEAVHISGESKKNNNFRAQKDNWEKFLDNRKEAKEIILYRPLVPFKLSELIEQHIDIAVNTEYGSGKYNLLSRNCEHFATLCVGGVPFSKQVDALIFPWKSGELKRKEIQKTIEENNRKFDILMQQSMYPNFTPEQIQAWISHNFTHQETKKWIDAGLQPADYDFCVWLRGIKKVDAEWVLNHYNALKQEYEQKIQGQTAQILQANPQN